VIEYWPSWLGAFALASIAVGFRAVHGRPLGVSGLVARILEPRKSGLRGSEDAIREALLKATRARFGDAMDADQKIDSADRGPLPWSYGTTFVAFLFLGGLFSQLSRGGGFSAGLGSEFESVVGRGLLAGVALLGGGFLVGFGTRMAGGCTSGHGLNGCAELQPASLLATVAFFGAAVAISFLLGAA
jgi:uncharacterized membrane protein YedE/YeeE